MIVTTTDTQIQNRMQRHIFLKFRYEGFRIAVPMYILFGVMDFVYKPQLAVEWIVLRIVFCLSMIFTIFFLKKKSTRKKYSQHAVVFNQVVACSIINLMIYQSGGFESLYLIGLILTSMISVNIFKISPRYTLVSLTLCYLPMLLIVSYTAGLKNWPIVLMYVFYFISFFILSYFYSKDNHNFLKKGMLKEGDFRKQINQFQKSEILKKQFPESLRAVIESGNRIPQKKFITNAVVGFADMTNSTKLANRLNLDSDWNLKELFIEMATRLATKHGYVVLTQLGDGFMFLANYEEENNWQNNLVNFFETLRNSFYEIKTSFEATSLLNTVDIKCAVAMGPTLVGFMGQEQTYFTAIGPDVNLAARLCSKAVGGQLIVTAKTWHVLKHLAVGMEQNKIIFDDIKGFEENISAVILTQKQVQKSDRETCDVCGLALVVVKNSEGLYDIACPQGHDTSKVKLLKVG